LLGVVGQLLGILRYGLHRPYICLVAGRIEDCELVRLQIDPASTLCTGKGLKPEPMGSPTPLGKGRAVGPSGGAAPAAPAAAATKGEEGASPQRGPAAADGVAANRSRLFADSPAPAADAAAAAAHGWQEVFDRQVPGDDGLKDAGDAEAGVGGGGDAAEAAAGPQSPAAGAAAAAAGAAGAASEGLPLDKDGNMPFYLIDAFENPDRPGAFGLHRTRVLEPGSAAKAGAWALQAGRRFGAGQRSSTPHGRRLIARPAACKGRKRDTPPSCPALAPRRCAVSVW
jgi:hypothetical protein